MNARVAESDELATQLGDYHDLDVRVGMWDAQKTRSRPLTPYTSFCVLLSVARRSFVRLHIPVAESRSPKRPSISIGASDVIGLRTIRRIRGLARHESCMPARALRRPVAPHHRLSPI